MLKPSHHSTEYVGARNVRDDCMNPFADRLLLARWMSIGIGLVVGLFSVLRADIAEHVSANVTVLPRADIAVTVKQDSG